MDPLTGFVVATVMMLLNGGVLGLMHKTLLPDVQPSARDWRIGTLLVAGGTILLAVQRALPLVFILPVATGFISTGVCLYWRAIRRFCGLPDRAWLFLPVGVVMVLIYIFAGPMPNLNARIVISCSLWIVIGVLAANTLRRYRVAGAVSHHVLAWVLYAMALFMLFRIGYFLTHTGVTQSIVDTENWMNAITPVVAAVLPVIGTTAFLLMCSERIRLQWEMAAATDYLTTLPNRRTIVDTGEARFGAARRTGKGFAVAMIDIDHFKRINDQFGHETGDRALKHVANILAQQCRGPHMVGRHGGEEFVALLEVVHADEAQTAAERLRSAVESTPMPLQNAPLNMTISLGVGLIRADDRSLENVIHRADQALYVAKANGRNRVEMG